MQACTKRLNNERAQLTKTNDDSIHLSVPNSEKLRAWSAVIKGPPASFYEGYEFDLEISVPEQYPMLPPQIKFLSKIFHPNVLYEVSNLQNNFNHMDFTATNLCVVCITLPTVWRDLFRYLKERVVASMEFAFCMSSYCCIAI